MVQATEFFRRPAGVCEICAQVVNLFTDNIKTYFILALLQSLAYIPVFLIFSAVAFAAFGSEAYVMYQGISKAMAENGGVRSLYESTSAWATAPPESEGRDWDTGTQSLDIDGDLGLVAFAQTMVWLFVLLIACVICIRAAFQGAFIRAAADIYSGRSPSWQACLQLGRSKMCHIAGFGLFYYVTIKVFTLAWFWFFGKVGGDSFAVVFFSVMAYIAAFIIFACSMTAAVTAIMVEDKGAVAAIGRSWNLCKSSIGFIFCTSLSFFFLEGLFLVFVLRIWFALLDIIVFGGSRSASDSQVLVAATLTIVAFWLGSILIAPFNGTLNPVIYMSLRIRHEGLTMEQLQGELSILEDSIELRSAGPGGVYGKVQSPKETTLV